MDTKIKLNHIKLIVYDFDGVMTDNKAIVDQNGKESVKINRSDGLGVSLIKDLGIYQMILSTEKNSVVSKRGEKLGIPVVQGVDDKAKILTNYCSENGFLLEETMYIGNDLNDYICMEIAGIKGCPSDAEPEIIEICDWVSKVKGGNGVIRELYRVLSNIKIANE